MDSSGGNLFSVGRDVPAALRGARSAAVAFNRIEEVLLSHATAAKRGIGAEPADDLLAFVRRQAVEAHSSADKLARLLRNADGPSYPQTALSERLKLVSRLLKGNVGARVFYTQQLGYDTHSQQQFSHATLLGEFAGAVAAFYADLKASKLADRVTLLPFSEFGRTIRENGSGGTDHGTAGAMFVAGPTVTGGVVGAMPSLSDLDQGEPKMTTDFRSVYATAVQGWMGISPEAALRIGVASLKLFA
jgi:uncharacterized protein (DUF1501 family)